MNFGETEELAAEVNITIGGLPCEPITLAGTQSSSIWQISSGVPYLLCGSAWSTVGPQDVEITCAGQTIRFEEDERRVVMECGDNSYGQEAGAVLESEVGCMEECEDDQIACMLEDAAWGFPANHTCYNVRAPGRNQIRLAGYSLRGGCRDDGDAPGAPSGRVDAAERSRRRRGAV